MAAWYGNVASTGDSLYYYPNGKSDPSTRIHIDNWNSDNAIAAFQQISANKVDASNWNWAYNKAYKLYNSAMASKRQEELQMAQIEAYGKMAEASMREEPALEPLKRAADASDAAKSETSKRQQQRASLLSQFRRSNYAQGQKSTKLGG